MTTFVISRCHDNRCYRPFSVVSLPDTVYGVTQTEGTRRMLIAGLEKWFQRWGIRPGGPRGKGSPSVSKGPRPPIQLLKLLKNSPREVERAHFCFTLGPSGSHLGNGINGAWRGRSLRSPPPPPPRFLQPWLIVVTFAMMHVLPPFLSRGGWGKLAGGVMWPPPPVRYLTKEEGKTQGSIYLFIYLHIQRHPQQKRWLLMSRWLWYDRNYYGREMGRIGMVGNWGKQLRVQLQPTGATHICRC